MSTSHIAWVREHKGIEAGFNEACETVRKQAADLEGLWNSRFFERRVLEGGAKKLWPCTEETVSRSHDLQDLDGAPLPEFFYCDDDGELYPVTVGKSTPSGADPEGPGEVPFVYASSAMVANGKVVGHVLHTDH